MGESESDEASPYDVALMYHPPDSDSDPQQRVAQLANCLSAAGLRVGFDKFVESRVTTEPEWLEWMRNAVTRSRFVLVVCSPKMFEAFAKSLKEDEIRGSGIAWEAHHAMIRLKKKKCNPGWLIPVLLNRDDDRWVPDLISAEKRYLVTSTLGRSKLLELLTGKKNWYEFAQVGLATSGGVQVGAALSPLAGAGTKAALFNLSSWGLSSAATAAKTSTAAIKAGLAAAEVAESTLLLTKLKVGIGATKALLSLPAFWAAGGCLIPVAVGGGIGLMAYRRWTRGQIVG